ncbi:MAG: helix-turn-helix transcriptional regulator [Deltaproteobacteria bacterium]|jgi:transcriptional regulator with XRE-family HTH domain|nr:helix-turn-helix transcriptional regulator [Deltaproteobacteria bacterium]
MDNENLDSASIAFRHAIKFEINKRGFGGQAELSSRSGVSKSLINDIVNGRATGSLRTRKILSNSLGYLDYDQMVEVGNTLMDWEKQGKKGLPPLRPRSAPKISEPFPAEKEPFEPTGKAPSTFSLLVENRNLRMELDQSVARANALSREKEEIERQLLHYASMLHKAHGVLTSMGVDFAEKISGPVADRARAADSDENPLHLLQPRRGRGRPRTVNPLPEYVAEAFAPKPSSAVFEPLAFPQSANSPIPPVVQADFQTPAAPEQPPLEPSTPPSESDEN